MAKTTEAWGSRVGLILAMAGNAVGLGNFLRFPVQAVQNGGGAFIIPYLVCFLLMGIPLLWVEWSIGRFGGKHGHHSTPFILDALHKKRIWKYIGVFGIFTNIAVASYYCYIESWTISYVYHSLVGTFQGMEQWEVAKFFTDYVKIDKSITGIPYEAVVFFVLCLILNTWILSRGLAGIEKVAMFGVPMLLIFGAFLAIKGVSIGTSGASADFPNANSLDGLNFLWTPQFDSLTNPKVWLAAAGQIFFTLSVGMGTIQCYSSYLRANDDVALNAVSAGFTNEFVEVVLGSMIVIPIAAGYLGIDWVRENAGFGMAFQTMPFLFDKWGPYLSVFAGVFWFGLLFFAGITSSLAMGTPWVGFMQDEFKWPREKAALSFGAIILGFGLPTVLYFNYGVFDEYDYWAGTVSLVVFALLEIILFAWIFGMDKAWAEIKSGADIHVPEVYKFIIKYVTPVLLLAVFVGALVSPPLVKKLEMFPEDISQRYEYQAYFEEKGFDLKSDDDGRLILSMRKNDFDAKFVSDVQFEHLMAADFNLQRTEFKLNDFQEWGVQLSNVFKGKAWEFDNSSIVAQIQNKAINDRLSVSTDAQEIKELKKKRKFVNLARGLLLFMFFGIAFLVYLAYMKRQRAL